ncbi:transposase [Anaerobutyricum hallii]|nr:transposase [Anaerobutyricum hallii]
MRYKLEEQGKKLVKVVRFFASSQTCSVVHNYNENYALWKESYSMQ